MKINKIAEYKGLKIGKIETPKPTKEEIDEYKDNLLKSRVETVTRDSVAIEGDIVNIDFKGMLDGEAFEGGTAEKYDLELGSGSFIPGFEEQLVGHKAGDKVDVKVTFPENYHAENLKGKAVVFECLIHEVKEKVTPKYDEKLAKDMGFENLEQLDRAIDEQIYVKKLNKDLNDYLTKVWDKIIADSDIELEDDDIKSKVDQMMTYYANSLTAYGMTLEQYAQMMGMDLMQYRESLKDEARKATKIDIIYDKIAELEALNVKPEEVDAQIAQMKQYYNIPDEETEKLKQDHAPELIREILRNKVSNLLIKNND